MAQGNGDLRKKTCAVRGCEEEAVVEVILYDVYLVEEHVVFERDRTCPFLYGKHVVEKERGAEGVRQPRGSVRYPFTNQEGAQGFTIYRPLDGS